MVTLVGDTLHCWYFAEGLQLPAGGWGQGLRAGRAFRGPAKETTVSSVFGL